MNNEINTDLFAKDLTALMEELNVVKKISKFGEDYDDVRKSIDNPRDKEMFRLSEYVTISELVSKKLEIPAIKVFECMNKLFRTFTASQERIFKTLTADSETRALLVEDLIGNKNIEEVYVSIQDEPSFIELCDALRNVYRA
ncbi:hypothetical protein K5V21_03430 [Clostridium sardiniense]|uniref:Uncharacterized protein n=1 Tax=Clostridium sardiniense TaxID=29369 RepID=A0ABS7KV93_CLOSR|nr:hypothetical protein [Clostridium sardiniense]MBY0754502.1 hypothetical protein [Clostridium sardiniense]MDQ0460149.1 hypothetical protein [Clostridium sardiniense]